jgi:hypothetical protein
MRCKFFRKNVFLFSLFSFICSNWQFYFYLHYELLSTYNVLSTSSPVAFSDFYSFVDFLLNLNFPYTFQSSAFYEFSPPSPACFSFIVVFWLLYCLSKGARGSVVGWGTMLQDGRSWDRVPMRWIFSNLPNPSGRTMALGSTQPLTQMSTRNLKKQIWGVKGGRRLWLTTFPPSVSRLSK